MSLNLCIQGFVYTVKYDQIPLIQSLFPEKIMYKKNIYR